MRRDSLPTPSFSDQSLVASAETWRRFWFLSGYQCTEVYHCAAMFSQTSEYALRVVVYLGSLGDRPATIPQIAAATRAPAGYLAKVLRNLAIRGIVRSQRGLHGGSVLAR